MNENVVELTAEELITLVNCTNITNDETNTEMVAISYNELVKLIYMYKDKIKKLEQLQGRGGFRVAELSIENEYLKNENEKQKAEIEQLTTKVKSYEMSDLLKQAYIDQLNEENKELVSAKVFELETKNTKLQKQIDELTEEILRLNKDIIEISTNYMREKIKSRQAVKDTAKEIYDELKNEVISVDIPRGGEPAEEDCKAVLWWKIEKILRKKAQVE